MDANNHLASAIIVVCKRLKQSEDSFEVFKDLVHLSITSMELKNIIDAETLVNISYRYIRGRSRFILAKLKYFARNNDINGFEKFADLVIKHYSQLEAFRMLNSMLLYSTEHSNSQFLKSYLDCIADRTLYLENLARYHADLIERPFMGFRPNMLIKSLKMAQKNKWTDKMILLFDLLISDKYLGVQNEDYETVNSAIKNEISGNNALHFAALGSSLMLMYHHLSQQINLCLILQRVIDDARNIPDSDPHLLAVVKVWFNEPIENRPWFFGNISQIEINNKLSGSPNFFLGAFYGSKLCFYNYKKKRLVRKELNKESMQRVPNYTVFAHKRAKEMHLYQFYCKLVANDIEAAKNIQQAHGINWSSVGYQPHPLVEYLNKVDDIKDDIIEWLFESMPPVAKIEWERHGIPDRSLPILKMILQQGAKIDTDLLMLLMRKEMPVKPSFMALLSKAWDHPYSDKKVFEFIFEEFDRHCRSGHGIFEKKILILLAWKFDQSSLFNNLPLEIVHSIVQLIDEKPLVYQFASLMAGTGVFIKYEISSEWYEKFPWGVKFVTENTTRFANRLLNRALISLRDCKYQVFRRDYQSIKKLLKKVTFDFSHGKIVNYLVKYETDPTFFENFRHLFNGDGFEVSAALKTRNVVALKFLFSLKHIDRTPTAYVFHSTITKKHKLSYEEAIAILKPIEDEMWE